jgi:hypothetical protein
MTDLETELRAVLHDPALTLTPGPEAVGLVVAGMRRRRRRRRFAVGTAAALVLAVAAPVALPQLDPFDSGEPDHAVSADRPISAPARAYRSPREDRPACDPVRLEKAPSADEGAMVANTGDSRCTLRGTVTLVGTHPVTGQRTVIAADALADDPHPDRQYPATIDPGEYARVDVEGCTGNGETWRDVAVDLGGREIPVTDHPMGLSCRPRVGSWYVRPPLLELGLDARITAPATVRRGSTLEFTVTLSNPAGPMVTLQPCPAYAIGFGGDLVWRRLDCHRDDMPAASSITLPMQVDVPRFQESGEKVLIWILVAADGRSTMANLADGGVRVTVLP